MSPEEEDIIMKAAREKAIKGLKLFAALLLDLPDDFGMDQNSLDEQLKDRTEKLYAQIVEAGMCLTDIQSSMDIMGVITSMTVQRCKNQTKALLSDLYKNELGFYEPENEMPISSIMEKLTK